MPAIFANLKNIRQAKGLSIEFVSSQLGVTSKLISSYESNRTQANLETLKKLAKIYDVELNDILYGTNKMQVQRRYIKLLAIFALLDILVCNFLQAFLLWIANKYFQIEPGIVTESVRVILEIRMTILDARTVVEWFSLISFNLCCLALLIMLIRLQHPLSLNEKLKYLAMLFLGSAITTLPLSFYDSLYNVTDYSFIAFENLISAVITFVLSIIGEHIYGKRQAKSNIR